MRINNLTKENIFEGNRLIAKFMELKHDKYTLTYSRVYYKVDCHDSSVVYKEDDFVYHKSLDWILPVLDKIKSFSQTTPINMDKDQIVVTYTMGYSYGHFCEIVYSNRLMSKWKDKKCSMPCDTKRIDMVGDNIEEAVWLTVVEFIKWYNQTNKL